jgi:hypothetical protein
MHTIELKIESRFHKTILVKSRDCTNFLDELTIMVEIISRKHRKIYK